MAMILKRDYELLSLRVGLRTTAERASVTCTLEHGTKGDIERLGEWTADPETFGLPRRLERRAAQSSFMIPPFLRQAIEPIAKNVATPDNVLWLHLDHPYGYLGLVPWETLSQDLGLPVLRLPDVIAPPPRETPSGLDVALCASSPVARSQFDVVRAVANFSEDAAAGMQRQVRLHVFADRELFPQLKQDVARAPSPNVTITIYDPSEAGSYAIPERDWALPEGEQTLRNPWLLWVRNAMRGRSLDVVHFIGHGYVAQERGALAVAESPIFNEDRKAARFIGGAELIPFLTQVGAWSVAFTSPPEVTLDTGLRLLADELGQRRPGSVLHHTAGVDPAWSALVQAYVFLYTPHPTKPPAHESIFIYCQPSQVLRFEDVQPETVLPQGTDVDHAVQAAFATDNVPVWLAASQRYLEQCSFQASQIRKAAAPDETRSVDEFEVVKSTLQQLQGVVARFSGGGGGQP
jgi:hypothetical protein